ncbi:TMhelix containing protein [Vibrio phage 1.030.O._10N.222.55.F9]|nr:TMhelix containing protein [Vibrio phage 1.030.O._10N.222.55.F9]
MKAKLLKFALTSFLAFLPLPFVFEWSFIFGNLYILVAVMCCGATARALGLKEAINANN